MVDWAVALLNWLLSVTVTFPGVSSQVKSNVTKSPGLIETTVVAPIAHGVMLTMKFESRSHDTTDGVEVTIQETFVTTTDDGTVTLNEVVLENPVGLALVPGGTNASSPTAFSGDAGHKSAGVIT